MFKKLAKKMNMLSLRISKTANTMLILKNMHMGWDRGILDTAEEQISQFEDKTIETIQNEKEKKRLKKKNEEEIIRELENNLKWTSACAVGTLNGQGGWTGARRKYRKT